VGTAFCGVGGGGGKDWKLINFNEKCAYAEGLGALCEKPDAFICRTVAAGSKRCLSGN